jgi:OmpA-OmpF porin, OOP family
MFQNLLNYKCLALQIEYGLSMVCINRFLIFLYAAFAVNFGSLHMNKKLVGLAVAATLNLTAFCASAEDMYRGAWYGGAGLGVMNTDGDLEAHDDVGGYVTLGKELSQSWDLQGRLGYTNAEEDISLAGHDGQYKSTALELDALYMFSRDKFRPFLLAGLGVTKNDLDYSATGLNIDEDKTSWLASLGLGAQYLINDTFGFQADLRHQFSRAEVANVSGGVYTGSSTETIGNTILSLGGFVRFGAPAPVVAEAAPEPAPIPVAEPAPIPVAEPAPEPAPMCEEKLDTVTIDAEKLFGFDKASIRPEGKTELDATAEKIKSNPEITNVIVTGHTDRLGSFEYNQKLSEERAAQVAEYLVAQGVDAGIITATGRGESVPVVACEGIKARKALIECLQPNRRVTVEANVKETVCK